MGGVGNVISSIFGGGPSYEPPKIESQPDRTQSDAEAKAVREEEQRKIKQRRSMSGTVLTSPLGTTGNSGNGGGVLGRIANTGGSALGGGV